MLTVKGLKPHCLIAQNYHTHTSHATTTTTTTTTMAITTIISTMIAMFAFAVMMVSSNLS